MNRLFNNKFNNYTNDDIINYLSNQVEELDILQLEFLCRFASIDFNECGEDYCKNINDKLDELINIYNELIEII